MPEAPSRRGDRAGSTMGNRDCPFLLQLVGVAGDDNPVATIRRHERSVKEALDLPGATYLNLLDGDERRHGGRTSIDPVDLAEIAALRRQLDPTTSSASASTTADTSDLGVSRASPPRSAGGGD